MEMSDIFDWDEDEDGADVDWLSEDFSG